MRSASAQIENTEETPAMVYVGQLTTDEDGYSIVNDKGETLAYFSRQNCNWSPMMVSILEGLRVEMIYLPGGQIALLGICA